MIMLLFLKKYYSIITFFAIILSANYVFYFDKVPLSDPTLIITNIIFTLLLIIALLQKLKKIPHFKKWGKWIYPDKKIILIYFSSGIIAALIDILSKIILFSDTNLTRKIIFNTFGIQSFLNITSNSSKDILIAITLSWIYLLGTLFFRLKIKLLQNLWLMFSAWIFCSGLILVLEKTIFKGVHDIYYFGKNLRYLCPPCGLKFEEYVWCPADIFLSWGFIFSILIFGLAFFIPTKSKSG